MKSAVVLLLVLINDVVLENWLNIKKGKRTLHIIYLTFKPSAITSSDTTASKDAGENYAFCCCCFVLFFIPEMYIEFCIKKLSIVVNFHIADSTVGLQNTTP